MKVVLLSTSPWGTLGHHLPVLHRSGKVDIAMVIVSGSAVVSRSRKYKRILKKILKIGVMGALNGVKMRKWYTEDVKNYTEINNAEDYCKEHGIPFVRTPYTNSKETKEAFLQSGAELGISLGNGYIAPSLFNIPEYGMLNIHHEVLPQYQNAQSIIWQLYNGSAETGYTIHKIDKKIDQGAILYQEKMSIKFMDTLAATVSYNYARLFDASAMGLVKVLSDFSSYYQSAKQQGKGGHYTTPSYRQFKKILKNFTALKHQSV